MISRGPKKMLGGLVAGVLGGFVGVLSFFFFADGLVLGGRRIPEGLQILVPVIIGAVLGAVVVGDGTRLPPGEKRGG